jgi:hypothetical protein
VILQWVYWTSVQTIWSSISIGIGLVDATPATAWHERLFRVERADVKTIWLGVTVAVYLGEATTTWTRKGFCRIYWAQVMTIFDLVIVKVIVGSWATARK